MRPAPLLVLLMIVLTFISQFWVSGNMAALRAQIGPLEALPASDALRVSFDRLHRLSVRLEVGVLLAGLVALLLTSRHAFSLARAVALFSAALQGGTGAIPARRPASLC